MQTRWSSTSHTRLRTAAVAAALAITSAACGGTRSHFQAGVPPVDGTVTRTQSMRSLLAYEEIAQHGMTGSVTLYQALERLRPEFLRPRRQAPSAIGGHLPEVYIESMRAGGLEVLRTIPVAHVQSVRYIKPVDALIRYGMVRDHQGGVILITLGRH